METSRAGRVMFPAAVVMVVAVMVIPLPTTLIDMLIVANISIAILILLVVDERHQDARVQLVPGAAADRHAVPPGAQRGDLARRAVERRGRAR